jgi:natural product precursor
MKKSNSKKISKLKLSKQTLKNLELSKLNTLKGGSANAAAISLANDCTISGRPACG